eukprot:GEMP01003449.1.p1 GENE.GEMP01003449.1~~GEMP01003449.1.p1  ORF type:complete len:984 (+),score=251.54 GEMP01003449.1:48-2954(+)
MRSAILLWCVVASVALKIHVEAPEDPRKEGGIKFETTLHVSSLEELTDAFVKAHSKTFEVHYTPPLFISGGHVVKTLDGFKDGATLRLYKPRGGIRDPKKKKPISIQKEELSPSTDEEPQACKDEETDLRWEEPLPTKKDEPSPSKTEGAPTEPTPTADRPITPNPEAIPRKENSSVVQKTDASVQTAPSTHSTTTIRAADPEAAFHDLALGGESTRRAAEELLVSSSFRHPFFATRVLHALSKTEDEATTQLLLRLLAIIPLEREDRQQAMQLADCNNTHWEVIVMRHFAEFPKARGVRRVAACNGELRKKLIQLHFDKQAALRLEWLKPHDPVEEYIGQQFARDIVLPKLQEQTFKRRISEAPLSFLFLGPSGVGKTELARRIASILHTAPIEELNDGRFVEFKMGNYATEEQFTQWIGVPDGVKGGEGYLTAALKKHPNAVIYLDEIEKARPSAGDRLLGFLDAHGTLQVAKTGEHVKTNMATWILSSNIGTDETIAAWNNKSGDYDAVCEGVRKAIEKPLRQSEMFRRPELRNRLSAIVPFTPFRSEEVTQIVQLQMQKLQRKYSASTGWRYAQINWTPDVISHFTKATKEETEKKGNVRALIMMVENEVSGALTSALDCNEPLCDALADEGCSLVPDKGNFFIEIKQTKHQGNRTVARYLPATIEEAQQACEQKPVSGDAGFYADGSSHKFTSPSGSGPSSGGHISDSGNDGGTATDSDVLMEWLVKIMDWERWRYPMILTVTMATFFSYGWMWSVIALFTVHMLDFLIGCASRLWAILPGPIRRAIVMGVTQFGGFVVKHWDVSLVVVLVCGMWVCKQFCCGLSCRRRMKIFRSEEEKNKALVKLILDTMEERDKRMIKFLLDAFEDRDTRLFEGLPACLRSFLLEKLSERTARRARDTDSADETNGLDDIPITTSTMVMPEEKIELEPAPVANIASRIRRLSMVTRRRMSNIFPMSCKNEN